MDELSLSLKVFKCFYVIFRLALSSFTCGSSPSSSFLPPPSGFGERAFYSTKCLIDNCISLWSEKKVRVD